MSGDTIASAAIRRWPRPHRPKTYPLFRCLFGYRSHRFSAYWTVSELCQCDRPSLLRPCV